MGKTGENIENKGKQQGKRRDHREKKRKVKEGIRGKKVISIKVIIIK